MSVLSPDPVVSDINLIRDLDVLLHASKPSLMGPAGQTLRLPDAVYEVLRTSVELMADGQSVVLLSDRELVSTHWAADFLGTSEAFFTKLLGTGAVPFDQQAGGAEGSDPNAKEPRVHLRDVLAYAKTRDREREEILNSLTRDAVADGLYGVPATPGAAQPE